MTTRREYIVFGCGVAIPTSLAGCSGTDDETADPNGDDGTGDDGSDNGNGNDLAEDIGDLGDEIDFDSGPKGEFGAYATATDERPVIIDGQKPSRLYETDGVNTDGQSAFYGTELSDIDFYASVRAGPLQSPLLNYELVFGPFEFETLQSELDGSENYLEVSESEEYRGFQTLEAITEDESDYFGLRDGELTTAGGRAQFESAIDMIEGDTALLQDEDDLFDSLLEQTGDPDLFTLYLEPEPDQMILDPTGDAIAGSAGIHLQPEESVYNVIVVYETESEATENEVAVAETLLGTVGGLNAVESGTDGRHVIVQASVSNSDL